MNPRKTYNIGKNLNFVISFSLVFLCKNFARYEEWDQVEVVGEKRVLWFGVVLAQSAAYKKMCL